MVGESGNVSSGASVRFSRLLVLIAIYGFVAHVVPSPDGVSGEDWRRVGVFFATIGGLMLQPMPGSQVVLVGIVGMLVAGGLPIDRALSGYSASSVWMVLIAMLMSRALRDSGLARRVALWFIRAIGRTSLGLGYALHLTDLTLATGVPSITARSASIVFPIARSVSGLYKSHPGASSALLGTFLMTCMYQGSVISSAMFFYSSAANLLLGDLAAEYAGVTITWTSWFVAGIVPGIVASVAVPYLVYRLTSPELKQTPAAAEFAAERLAELGPIRGREAIVGGVFIGLIVFWVASSYVPWLSPTLVAFLGITALFLTQALTWNNALDERSAWDVFIWYGGLLMMGGVLNETGVTALFAEWIGSWFLGASWVVVFLWALLIYFYAHYFFASTTVHALALYPPFLALLVNLGAPAPLVVYSFVFINNLAAGLTHYGTTTSPVIFIEGYVSLKEWWRVGFYASALNLVIWLPVGMLWWKVLGLW
ncbi:MAG: anion permease [Acidobacteria bacterium]|nr:anion permease [Acidobacteriota bacterium]|tara:strand:- start:2969 stop:4411 length:1443 start_codon:yes stop_codon:yes gene_type:complete